MEVPGTIGTRWAKIASDQEGCVYFAGADQSGKPVVLYQNTNGVQPFFEPTNSNYFIEDISIVDDTFFAMSFEGFWMKWRCRTESDGLD